MLKGLRVKLCHQEWMQIFAILTGALGALNTAALYAWPSPSIPILLSEGFPANVTLQEAAYTTIIPSLSSIISSPLCPYMIDRFGRKPTLLFIAAPQFAAWILVVFAKTMDVIYISRFLSGFANCCVFTALPCYISEVSSPKIRGLWGNAMSCFVYFGVFLMNLIGGFCTMQCTAVIFSVLPVIYFIILLGMPETPYYYLMRGEDEAAAKALKKLRNDEDVDKELEEMKIGVERQLSEPGKLVDILRGNNLKILLVGITIRAAQQFSGISTFAVYTQYIFLQTSSDISAASSAIIYSLALTICSLICSSMVDRLGRRNSMAISCLGCSLVLIFDGFYYYFELNAGYFPIIGMVFYVFLYSIGLGVVPNLILGELYASNIKAKALCILNIFFAIFSSCSNEIFHLLNTNFGMYAPFFLYGSCCIISLMFSLTCIPETSGKTLEEIQIELKS